MNVGELLETALRSRQRANLPNEASHEALAQAIIKSPVFPVLFIHLVKQRRGDLVGSLLELLRLVPPLPSRSEGTGPFASLSNPEIVNWTGLTDDIIPTDRPVIIQAAAKAKLRWHAAFLYHKWAEDPLQRDNNIIFERLGTVVGGAAASFKWSEPDAATARIGLPMTLICHAVANGIRVQSNPVCDSVTCTFNMVKLFAATDAAAPSSTATGPALHRDNLTETEFARLIFAAHKALNSNRTFTPQELTTLSAAAFALKDTETALSLLSKKVQSGQVPDIVDIGVVLAGVAGDNIEMAVNMFLNKLNKVETTGQDLATDEILQQLQPSTELYSMLISKSMFRSRNDLVARLLEDADKRGMMSSAVMRSLDVILRQHIDVRPQGLLDLLRQLTQANEWTPDPRILAWFCRCASRGQSLKEAMDRAQVHAAASTGTSSEKAAAGVAAEEATEEHSVDDRQLGDLEDLTAAVGILRLSGNKLGYAHGPTVLLLVKSLALLARDAEQRPALISLLDQVVEVVFRAKRVDLGSQQRSMADTKWAEKHNARREGSMRGPRRDVKADLSEADAHRAQAEVTSDTSGSVILRASFTGTFAGQFANAAVYAYTAMRDFRGAAEVVMWLREHGMGQLVPLSRATRDLIFEMLRHEPDCLMLRRVLRAEGRVDKKKGFWRTTLREGNDRQGRVREADGFERRRDGTRTARVWTRPDGTTRRPSDREGSSPSPSPARRWTQWRG
ncbi:hypothetical protein OC844_006447 [Tilletia horrida]|nr:hypothetical protein OC844_006447 [Tilletia horrida]